ncbi:AbiV family abortive infection protein [Methylobacterium ajmalii]|uniref:AbiV family abortive infection protein n=1 Tax=Methylobacterium ajmalii TaxID=2738439 RepID=A0ABU9ZMM2_9HYPH
MSNNRDNIEISIQNITKSMILCRENSLQLKQEAMILLERNRQARAYALLHTACEELAKFFMLENTGRRLLLGQNINWKRFWQRIRSHNSKIAAIRVKIIHENALDRLRSKDIEIINGGLTLLWRLGIQPRNSSLYVELDEKMIFQGPSQIDWEIPLYLLRGLCSFMINLSNEAGADEPSIQEYLRNKNSKVDRDDSVNFIVAAATILRDEGMTKEQFDKIFAKYYT